MKQYDLVVNLDSSFMSDATDGTPGINLTTNNQTIRFSIPLPVAPLPSVDTVSAIDLVCARIKSALLGLLQAESKRVYEENREAGA